MQKYVRVNYLTFHIVYKYNTYELFHLRLAENAMLSAEFLKTVRSLNLKMNTQDKPRNLHRIGMLGTIFVSHFRVEV